MKPLNLLQLSVLRFGAPGSSAVSAVVEPAVEAPRGFTESSLETETASAGPVASRPVDPMLLVYQERVRTFRLLVRWIGDAGRAVMALRAIKERRAPARRPVVIASRVDSGAT